MTNTFKIRLKQQLLVSLFCWLKYVIFFSIYLYPYGFVLYHIVFAYIFAFLFLTDLLPAIILHVQYFIQNRQAVLTISKSDKTISYSNSRLNRSHHFDEIAIFKYVACQSGMGSPGWYSFGDYRYCHIGFNNGTEIIITCLMVPDI